MEDVGGGVSKLDCFASDTKRLYHSAIAFAYFESLLRLGDKNKFLEEETRLKSLNNLMNIAGFDKWAYEDFADETYGLMRKYMGMVDAADVEASLVADFNNEETQNYIITHFKVGGTLLDSFVTPD